MLLDARKDAGAGPGQISIHVRLLALSSFHSISSAIYDYVAHSSQLADFCAE